MVDRSRSGNIGVGKIAVGDITSERWLYYSSHCPCINTSPLTSKLVSLDSSLSVGSNNTNNAIDR
jgi:hypothetical protein